MSRQIPRPFESIALLATLLVIGLGVGAPATTARADDCLAAPNSPAPQSSHWYYRTDRAKQRKCWYLRAADQAARQETTRPTSEAATAAPSAGAPISTPSGDDALPIPRVKMLAVKPQPAPMMSAPTDGLVQQNGQEGNAAPPNPQGLAPQVSTSQTSAQAAAPPPAAATAWPDPPPAVADPTAVPSDPHADSVRPKADAPATGNAESPAPSREPATSAGTANSLTVPPVELFLILTLGLAVAGILSRIVAKIAAARRESVIIDQPDSSWIDDQSQHEWRDDQHQDRIRR